MKRFALVALLALVLVLASATAAFANFGPHGGYAQDTDSCAGCHRAHTSFSDLGWTDQQGADRKTALLVANAASMTEFCYVCHGNAAPGASTNVQEGVFDAGPTADGATTPNNTTTFYQSNSTFGAPLNGGGFERVGGSAGADVVSSHLMDAYIGSLQPVLIKWGNASLAPMAKFTCNDCHDPHGSSNYRLLKDQLAGAGDMTNYVTSNEKNFPATGFRSGPAGVADIASYVPNYTAPYYAKSNPDKGMSAWCSGCHSNYNVADGTAASPTGTYDYAMASNPNGALSWPVTAGGSAKVFHRHLLGVPLDPNMAGSTERALNKPVQDDAGLPLEMGVGTFNRDATPVGTDGEYKLTKPWDGSGFIACLTCHQAHGNASSMSGWAVANLDANGYPFRVAPGSTVTTMVPVVPAGGVGHGSTAGHGSPTNIQGVAPNFSQDILRYPNRGVCERCHNK